MPALPDMGHNVETRENETQWRTDYTIQKDVSPPCRIPFLSRWLLYNTTLRVSGVCTFWYQEGSQPILSKPLWPFQPFWGWKPRLQESLSNIFCLWQDAWLRQGRWISYNLTKPSWGGMSNNSWTACRGGSLWCFGYSIWNGNSANLINENTDHDLEDKADSTTFIPITWMLKWVNLPDATKDNVSQFPYEMTCKVQWHQLQK